MAKRGLPKYCRHPNGQAFVQHRSIDRPGHRLYLGKWNTEASRKAYQQFIARLNAASSTTPATSIPCADGQSEICILLSLWVEHGKAYYRGEDGRPTQEYDEMVRALRWLDDHFGQAPADSFGPKSLKLIRTAMVASGLARSHINHQVNRIKRFWRWAVSEELCRPDLAHALGAVDPLQKGREGVREAKPVKPVELADVNAVLPYCSGVVAAMVRVQLLCGMRPQDVCNMRPTDIDRTGDVWIYRPETHKNAWRGKTLTKGIPPTAQTILVPYLDRPADAYLFSPREAYREIRARKAPPSVGDRYVTASYRRAIKYAITKRNNAETEAAAKENRDAVHVPAWSPNQLRHTAVTLLSESLGQQAAQRWAGHSNLDTTALYTEIQDAEIVTIAKAVEQLWTEIEPPQ